MDRCAVIGGLRESSWQGGDDRWPPGRLGLLVIDGYVDLDPCGGPGLGAQAHAAFGVPVIGVAKTRFRTASHAVDPHR
jgi:deoxyinosine 3'endonuclease (endonuclease V)